MKAYARSVLLILEFFFVLLFVSILPATHTYTLTHENQLNQQNQSTKPATTQDYNFLTDASSIYVTSLAGNHVTGTTTLTTSNVSSCNLNSAQSQAAGSDAQQPSHITQSIVHVHQPPTPTVRPLAGGWLIGDSAKGTPITANEQQVYQNILNNNNSNTNSNNISVSSAGGTIVYSSNSVSSVSESTSKFVLDTAPLTASGNSHLGRAHGGSVDAQTETSTELLANGYGPKKEVSARTLFFSLPLFIHESIQIAHFCCFLNFQQLSASAEGTALQESSVDTNRISSIGNTSLPVQTGRNEILLGDQSLRQDNR